MDVEIFAIGPEQIPRLAVVDDEVFDARLDPERLRTFVADPTHRMICAFADGVCIGQARGVITRQPDGPSSLYIDNLGVAPSHRRLGLASRLLDELVAWGRANDCASAWVATEMDNEAARALYAGRGAEFAAVAYYAYEI
jgi:aminoglycoside 6'-N-acetyltransferase I